MKKVLSLNFALILSFVINAQDSTCLARLEKTFLEIPFHLTQRDVFNGLNDTSKFIQLQDTSFKNKVAKKYQARKSGYNANLYDSVIIYTMPVTFQKKKDKSISLGYYYGITYHFNTLDSNFQKSIDDWYEYYFQTFSYCTPYHSEWNYKKSNITVARFNSVSPSNYPIFIVSKSTKNNEKHFITIIFNSLTDYNPGKPYNYKEYKKNYSDSVINDNEPLRNRVPLYFN